MEEIPGAGGVGEGTELLVFCRGTTSQHTGVSTSPETPSAPSRAMQKPHYLGTID